MSDPIQNFSASSLFLRIPLSYAETELPAAWRSRYGKVNEQGAYVATTFGDLALDPAVQLPFKKVADSPNVYLMNLTKGFTRQMLNQIITANGSNPDVDILDWADARAAARAYDLQQGQ